MKTVHLAIDTFKLNDQVSPLTTIWYYVLNMSCFIAFFLRFFFKNSKQKVFLSKYLASMIIIQLEISQTERRWAGDCSTSHRAEFRSLFFHGSVCSAGAAAKLSLEHAEVSFCIQVSRVRVGQDGKDQIRTWQPPQPNSLSVG